MLAGARQFALAVDDMAGAAPARALRIASLRHEAADHAVKWRAVVEALLHEADEIGHGVGGRVLEQFDHHFALRRGDRHAGAVVGFGISLAGRHLGGHLGPFVLDAGPEFSHLLRLNAVGFRLREPIGGLVEPGKHHRGGSGHHVDVTVGGAGLVENVGQFERVDDVVLLQSGGDDEAAEFAGRGILGVSHGQREGGRLEPLLCRRNPVPGGLEPCSDRLPVGARLLVLSLQDGQFGDEVLLLLAGRLELRLGLGGIMGMRLNIRHLRKTDARRRHQPDGNCRPHASQRHRIVSFEKKPTGFVEWFTVR